MWRCGGQRGSHPLPHSRGKSNVAISLNLCGQLTIAEVRVVWFVKNTFEAIILAAWNPEWASHKIAERIRSVAAVGKEGRELSPTSIIRIVSKWSIGLAAELGELSHSPQEGMIGVDLISPLKHQILGEYIHDSLNIVVAIDVLGVAD